MNKYLEFHDGAHFTSAFEIVLYIQFTSIKGLPCQASCLENH